MNTSKSNTKAVYTEIKGQIVGVEILTVTNNTVKVKSCYDGAEAFRVKSEVFYSFKKAQKYFN